MVDDLDLYVLQLLVISELKQYINNNISSSQIIVENTDNGISINCVGIEYNNQARYIGEENVANKAINDALAKWQIGLINKYPSMERETTSIEE